MRNVLYVTCLEVEIGCDEETVISGVKNYARYADKDLNRLFTYASILRVDKTLKKYLEVLL